MKTGSSNQPPGTHPGPLPHRRTTDLPEERKLITVMFADISGFTGLAEIMDPEHLRDLMNACFDHLVPAVTQFGGTVDKFIGDEIMALFGAPFAHENDAERALRAALKMRCPLSVCRSIPTANTNLFKSLWDYCATKVRCPLCRLC
jgi:adenylate cyclase